MGIFLYDWRLGFKLIKPWPYHAGQPAPRPIRLGTTAGSNGMLLFPFPFESR